MWSPTLLFDRRAYGPEKLPSVTQKDFCNTICQTRTSPLETVRSALHQRAEIVRPSRNVPFRANRRHRKVDLI
jgi:hypothetical protein